MDEVELLVLEDPADPRDCAGREHDVRHRAVRRHDDRAADGDDPVGQRSVPAGARMQEARQDARGVVAHQDRHVVAAAPESSCLMLGVLDDSAPVRPRERYDDADLHLRGSSDAGSKRVPQALDAELDRLVADREREARPAGAARAEALAGSNGEPMLLEQPFGREPFGQPEPDEERALADRRLRKHGGNRVAAALVAGDALGDRVLRPFERGDRGALQRLEDADAIVIVQQVDALDDLGVPDDEPDAPARHAVGLRHRPHLDPDVLGAGSREKALRRRPSKTMSM